MAASTAALIASAVIAAGGTAASISQQRKSQRAQEKASAVDRAQAEIANQRAIRQQIIRSRAQQAQLQAQGIATGTSDTSAQAGGLGSAQTQAAANVGFARQSQAAGRAVNELTSRASSAQGRAATFGAVAALPGQFGFDISSLFEQQVDQSNAGG